MNSQPDPEFLDSLALSLDEAWTLLGRGSKDRKSPLHMPSVGTVAPDGTPRQRIMVLREVKKSERLLRFHTDVRADKVTDIGGGAPISILGYHPAAKVQLRLTGHATVEQNSAAAEAAWQESTLFGQRCYLAEPAPGSPVSAPTSGLPADLEGVKPSPEDLRPARPNFAILLAAIDRIEWLYLAHTGHRRAAYNWDSDSGQWQGEWLVP